MIPFKQFERELILKKTPYEIFGEVDRLDLTRKLFDSNAFDLVAVIEQTEPLLISFKNETDYLGRKSYLYVSPLVYATVLPYLGGSKVVFRVKTDPVVYIVFVLMMLCVFANMINSGPILSSLLFATILVFLIPLDLYTRKSILRRTETVISQYD